MRTTICSVTELTPRLALPQALAATMLLAALAGIEGCRSRAGTAFGKSAADTAWVGVAVGLKTPARYVNVFAGVQQALDELNAARGPGTPFLAIRRAPVSAASPVEVAAAFRDDPHVIAVVGHTESDATISAAAVYEDRAHGGRDPLAAVSPTASAALVTRVSPWIFRVCPVGDEQARAIARYAADSLGVRLAAVLYRNDASGKDFLRAFEEEFSRRGGSVSERDPFTEAIPEFDAYAMRIGRGKVPLVVMQGNAGDERTALAALRRLGGAPAMIGSNPPEPPDSAAARAVRGMRYIVLYSADRPVTPVGRRFAAEFARRTGHASDHWAALGYDAAMLIGSAAHEVGPDRRAIRDWLAAVGTDRPAIVGATGRIAFDANRDPVQKQVLVRTVGE